MNRICPYPSGPVKMLDLSAVVPAGNNTDDVPGNVNTCVESLVANSVTIAVIGPVNCAIFGV